MGGCTAIYCYIHAMRYGMSSLSVSLHLKGEAGVGCVDLRCISTILVKDRDSEAVRWSDGAKYVGPAVMSFAPKPQLLVGSVRRKI
jgi:hypothetical protein